MTKPDTFTTQEVQNFLANPVTQTRRIIKSHKLKMIQFNAFNNPESQSPWGGVGDKIWVRETWGKAWARDVNDLPYKLENPIGSNFDEAYIYKASTPDNYYLFDSISWKSPVTMPKEVSRTTLEITEVRVERIQDISGEDCCKEGIFYGVQHSDHVTHNEALIREFTVLWNTRHGKDAWERNDFVWVRTHRKVEV